MHTIAKFIYYKILGWHISGVFPEVKKCVVIVVPHTSNYDFLLGLLIRAVLKKKISYVAKKSLFKPPYGWFFRWVGGTPIDRSKTNDTVKTIAAIFHEKEEFRLALSPEGTRKKVAHWKTGFYYIAKEAAVPIVLVSFDYGKKQIKISELYAVTTSVEQDFNFFKAFFKGVKGKNTQ